MVIIADTHTHTIASTHAYSTLLENVAHAKKIGIKLIASTDHCPALPGAPQLWYFHNMKAFPDVINGVGVLKGCECNILDYKGNLDMTQKDLERLDWVIASFHNQVCEPGTPEQHTNAYLEVAKNPHIDVIGHCGDQRFRFDYERVIPVFKEYGKLVEINNHSFTSRPGSDVNCREIARLCKKYELPVVVSTDAHFCTEIGEFSKSIALLQELDFPEHLVMNADFDRFMELVTQKSGRSFAGIE